jgi:hypothetical protein
MRSSNCLAALLFTCQVAVAQSNPAIGKFVEIEPSLDSRSFHSATLLSDGQVLLVGGNCNFQNTKCNPEAETYDPASNTFHLTGPMRETRALHSALLLPDGRVLISGGVSQLQLRSSAEIYDPATRSFGPLLAMKTPRYHHNSILLPNGKVMIVGGANRNPPPEIFDPVTNSFEWLEGDWTGMPERFVAASGGGIFGCSSSGASAALLIPSGSQIDRVRFSNINCSVDHHSMTLLLDGTVLIAGGSEAYFWFPEGTKKAQSVSPESRNSSPIEDLKYERAGHTATLMPDGSVMLLGGVDAKENQISAVELYSPALRRFSIAGSMWLPRAYHTATLLTNGKVLVVGGASWSRSVELYEPSNPIPGPSLVAAVHAGTGRLVSATDPAREGSLLEIYGTGLETDGKIPPVVTIGGKLAEVLHFGKPAWADGQTYQINVRVPQGSSAARPVALQLRYLDRPSNVLNIQVE